MNNSLNHMVRNSAHPRTPYVPPLYAAIPPGTSPLTRDEEADLFAKMANGDDDARTTLVNRNRGLVVNVAAYYGMGLDITADLIQEGMIGLLRAMELFDPDRGFKFSTFAVHHIRSTCQKALSRYTRIFYLPNHTIGRLYKLKQAYNRVQSNTTREPTIEELSTESGIGRRKVQQIMEVAALRAHVCSTTSSDDTPGKDIEQIPGIADERADCAISEVESAVDVKRLLDCLTAEERYIIEQRFGLQDGVARIWSEVSEAHSTKQAQTVGYEALEKLRKAANE